MGFEDTCTQYMKQLLNKFLFLRTHLHTRYEAIIEQYPISSIRKPCNREAFKVPLLDLCKTH